MNFCQVILRLIQELKNIQGVNGNVLCDLLAECLNREIVTESQMEQLLRNVRRQAAAGTATVKARKAKKKKTRK